MGGAAAVGRCRVVDGSRIAMACADPGLNWGRLEVTEAKPAGRLA
jgi:hypothetical protein